MNRRGVLCEEVYHVLQFPSAALSVSGNMGIISACLPVFGRHSGKHPLYSRAKERKKRVMTKCSDICLLLTY